MIQNVIIGPASFAFPGSHRCPYRTVTKGIPQ